MSKNKFGKKTIRIEAVDVKTEDGICPGIAQTKQGEICLMGGRTPENPVCVQALHGILPMGHAMSLTDKMGWEKKDYFDVTCPHGKVVFRISREVE